VRKTVVVVAGWLGGGRRGTFGAVGQEDWERHQEKKMLDLRVD
jgi:hypothetical protein